MKRMTMSVRLWMVLPLLILVSGCATLNLTSETVVPEMKLASEMPVHAQKVANAVVMRLGNASEKAVSAETGVAGSGRIAPESNFGYSGFRVRQVKFRDHVAVADRHYALGYITMQDTAGRNASVSFTVNYTAKGPAVAIEDGAVVPLFSAFPQTEMFVIPLSALTALGPETTAAYGRMYAEIAAAAVPMRDPGSVPSGMDDYAIVVFTKDRVSPGMTFEVWPSHSETRVGGKIVGIHTAATYYLYDTGWYVGMVPGNFSVASKWPFWVKAIVTDQRPGGNGEASQVGLFSSNSATPRGKSAAAGHAKSAVNHATLPRVVVAAKE